MWRDELEESDSEVEDNEEEEETIAAKHDGHEAEVFTNKLESLVARMQIDMSLSAVLTRIQVYHAAYVSRVAAIHTQTMAELQRCRDLQLQQETLQEKEGLPKHEEVEGVLKKYAEKILSQQAAAADLRKEELLQRLQEQQQQQQEQQQLLEQQQQEQERATMVAELRESYAQFSDALDTVLAEITECGDVALPEDTTEALNATLQLGSEALSGDADAEALQQSTARLTDGLAVLSHIREVIQTHRNSSRRDEQESEAAATLVSLAGDVPQATAELSCAKRRLEELTATHSSVMRLSGEFLATEDTELRGKLSYALSVVNKFHNDSDASNREKLHTLVSLLTGQRCAAGAQHVQVADPHSPVAMFVKEQLSSKLIALAHDKQVSSQAVYASLIVRLGSFDPLLLDLCVYQLYRTCPYLVPQVPQREEYETVEEYHRALGYRHKDGGEREALDSYLKRMGAASQLFGRLVCLDGDKPPTGQNTSTEQNLWSLGPQLGWRWLSRMLLCPVQSAVTCAVLHGFLSVAGALMVKVYGRQMHKMMDHFIERLLPLAEQTTREGGEADLASLKSLMTNYSHTRTFQPPPEGYRALL
ncbi:mRNA export factor GLE1 [Hyalella azteca]|uniref:mRNA export factor GLE1 n=1 Tax=Hyalella azteca TaxID=294128 RepID=A0A8B7NPJ1_HYAAZ|nr:mRNA export factor GLE1 [Hyalella azteca]